MAEKFSDSSMQSEILDSISCGVFAYTIPEHEIITLNDEARYIINCKSGDNVTEKLVEFIRYRIHPDDREKFLSVEKELRQAGDVVRYSYRAIIDGKTIHIKSTVKRLRMESGQDYILGSIIDITSQVALTESLARERKSYRNALANGSEFNFLFDVTEGIISEEFITAHKYNLIADLGMSVPVGFDDMLRRYVEVCGIEFVNENMAKNFTCKGLLEQFSKGITNVVTEYYNPSSDMYLRTVCLMSRDDETGHIYGAVVANDITELRQKEKAQRESLKALNNEMTHRIDAILNGISGGLKIADVMDDYRYEYISEGAAQLQGYTVDEFLEKFGRRVTSNIYPEDGEAALAEAERQMVANGGFYKVKYRVPHKDGSIRWVIDRGKLIEDSTGGKHWYILMQDVTELEDRNAQLSNVLAMQQEMADCFSCGFFAYTVPDRNVLIVNQEALRIFNIMGMDDKNNYDDIMSHIDKEDVETVRENVIKLRNVGDKISYVFHSTLSCGNRISVRADSKLLSFANGQKYILSSMTDITEQELMEKKLDEERRQYRNALAFGSEAMFTIDLTPDTINTNVMLNNNVDFLTELGLELPVTYNEFASAWLAEDRIITENSDIDLMRNRQKLIEACENGRSIIEIEYYESTKKRYYHTLVLLYKIDFHIFANVVIYDITLSRKEEKQKKAIIESLGKIYTALYHFSIRDNVYTVLRQIDDISEYINHQGNLNYFIDMYLKNFVEPEFREVMKEFMNPQKIVEALADAEFTTIEFRRKNLGWFRVNVIVCERDKNGNVISVVFAGNVVDEQKNKELKQQEALKAAYESANMANSAKTDFLANMSHDIRTPMNAIIGLTAIAGTHIDDRDCITDCLSKITVASKHLLGIINDVLDMSKIESGKMDLQEDEFNLPELIDNLLIMSRSEVAAKNHQLNVSIKNIDHEYVIGDSQRIQQMFMNIMSNAIKYTENGGRISLTISEKATNKTKVGCYEFIFEDNGIGMSEEFQKHIFEPFTRSRTDNRINNIQGTGLGLPITKNIVQMMNGDIKVESRLNEGTRITVTLFLKLKNESENISYEKFLNLPILVVDDDETSCLYTCQLLSELGMKGDWVLTGAEALEKVSEHHEQKNDFFAVIIDWKMPDMDGIETTKQIRQKVGRDVPIIIISAYDWNDIELEARQAGANAFISKPLFKSRVVHMFNELICGEQKEQNISELDAYTDEDFSGKRALLVEDNELNAEIAGEILDMAGITVEYAKNGKEAVDIMQKVDDGYYDVVFMDIQMPIMNGYEATRAIRALSRSYTKSVPIIAMTANAFAEDVAMAKNAGMNEHIAKPLDFGQLFKALRKWLK